MRILSNIQAFDNEDDDFMRFLCYEYKNAYLNYVSLRGLDTRAHKHITLKIIRFLARLICAVILKGSNVIYELSTYILQYIPRDLPMRDSW